MSDDENELEKLRIAALQTLKHAADVYKQALHPAEPSYIHHKPSITWRKFPGHGRGSLRNGHFNGRNIRNTNLISIPTSEPHTDLDSPKLISNAKPAKLKLDLPQNRYCSKSSEDADSEDSKKESSKFSRYDDNSDSDSENSETEASEGEDKLLRSSSLEALVQELEFEISGEKPPINAASKKTKLRKTKQSDLDTSTDSDRKLSDRESEAVVEGVKVDDAVDQSVDCSEPKSDDSKQQEATTMKRLSHAAVDVPVAINSKSSRNAADRLTDRPPASKRVDMECKPARKSPQRGLLPKPRGFIPRYERTRQQEGGSFTDAAGQQRSPGFLPQYQQYTPVASNTHATYSPPASHYFNPHPPVRPLSPLVLSQEKMSTITMAPLSPRSAAFVLQNREIIEKRKRSPRHSYSRSPSPRVRRSKSPRRRSPSPRKYARSTSPKKSSPNRRPRTPVKRRTRSPIDRSPKRDIKERLTMNNNRKIDRPERSDRQAASPDIPPKIRREMPPDRSKPDEKPDKGHKEEKERDPVLEARRRKFEQQTVNNEGIIRLKSSEDHGRLGSEPKSEEQEEETHTPEPLKVSSDIEEDAEEVFDADTLETHIDDLFSDEESEDENEGRFKSRGANRVKGNVPILNFASLTKPADVEKKSLDNRARNIRDRGRRAGETRKNDRGRDRIREVRQRSPLPADRKERVERVEKKDDRKELRRDEDVVRRAREPPARPKGEAEKKEERKPVKLRLTVRRDEKDDKNDCNDKSKTVVAEKIPDREEKRSERYEVKCKEIKIKEVYVDAPAASIRRDKERPITARKVAIAITVKENKEDKPKDDVTVIDDDDEQDVIKKNEAGDLRAQLSRKRAQRQNQKPTIKAEDVQTRLLHNALGAVFKKSKKSKRTDAGAAPKEKLPIHRRLGLNEEANTKKKKSKRSSGEQV